MNMKLGAGLAPVAAILLFFLLACTPAASSNTPSNTGDNGVGDAPTPDNGALAGAESLTVAVDRETLAAFAANQQAINADWDQFHADFDGWRAGLTSCDRSAAWSAFRGFSGDFSAITEEARALPGSGITRELAYGAIDAAVLEESALRQLRDNWQPSDVALLGKVQVERNSASLLRRETADRLDELQDLDKPEERAAAEEFSEAFATIDADWKAFHDTYDALRKEQDELLPEAVVERLEALVKDFELIVDALDELDELAIDAAIDDVAEELLEAASTELNELEALLDAFHDLADDLADEGMTTEKVAEALERAETVEKGLGAEPGGLGDTETTDTDADAEQKTDDGEPKPPEPEPEPTPVPGPTSSPAPSPAEDNSALFQDMDRRLKDSNRARKDAKRDLDTLVEGVSEKDLAALADFAAAFAELQRNWDAFHRDYDAWSSDEGGCDRAAAAQSLNRFDQRFNELGARVRGLSQASYLRPSSDLLAEAVGGEAAALRSLRNAWRPFETDVYRELDQERANADNLRRLAGRRTQEAMERFGAAP